MKLSAESTILDDKKIENSFATLQVDADGIRTEVGKKVGNNEIISRINQSPESIQIEANRVEIDGTAIFNAINDDVDDAISDAVDDIEIGGRNLCRNTGFNDLSMWYGNPSVSDGKLTITTATEVGLTADYRTDYTIPIGTQYTVSCYFYENTIVDGNRRIYFRDQPEWGYWTVPANFTGWFSRTTTASQDITRLAVEYDTRGATSGKWVVGPVKIELGNKATDWTPAPEDIKSIHTLMAPGGETSSSATYAQILNWCKEGISANWSVTSTAGVKIGDTVRVGYWVSNMGTAGNRPVVYCVGTVTAILSAVRLTMTMHGLDTTIIDGGNIITNSITANQIAANAITSDELAANAVTAGKIATNAIDTSKLTVGTQNDVLNSNVLVGGGNLFGYGSQCESLGGFSCVGTWDITTEDGFTCAHAAGVLTTTKYLRSKISFTPKPLEIMTFSLNVKIKNIVYGTTNPMCELYFNGQTIDGTWRAWSVLAVYIDGVKYEGSITNIRFPTYISDTKWHHFAVVARAVDANFTSNLAPSIYLRDATGDLYVRNIKYERGNKATDWSPAPEDTPKQLGVNMLRGTASMGVGNRYYNYGDWRTSGGTATNIKFTVAPPVTGLTHLIRVTNTGSAANQIGIAQDRIPGAMINANYTISCWVRLSIPGWVYIRAFYYDGNTYSTASNDFYIGTSWRRISWTGALVGTQYNQYSGGYIYFKNAPVNAYMDVCGMKVEEGIIPTDWCPALSDNGLLRKISFTSFNKETNITLSPNSAGTTLTITYTGSATTAHYGGYVNIPCEPNTTYDVGFFINPTGQWYFSSGSDGSSNNWTGLLGYQTLPTSTYRTCYRIITGTNDTSFRLYFSTQAASTSLYIDDLTIVSCDMTMASQLATNYITDIGSDGIRVHDSHTSNNSVVINSDGVEVFKGGNSVAFYGDTARVGKSATGHVEIYGGTQGGGLQVYETSNSMLANIGYGNGNAESGTAIAPYFTFGMRKSGTAVGTYSVVNGYDCTASGSASYAEGRYTIASGVGAHAEGHETVASDYEAHAEGNLTTASQLASHAEGSGTTASGIASHAEGMQTQATGEQSHAGGYHTIAQGECQTAIGLYNVADSTSLFIVGNGNSSARANAFLVDADGNVRIKGDIYAGCNANSAGGTSLNSKTYGTITSSHMLANNQCYLIKRGNVVTLTLGITLIFDVSAYGTIATLQAGYRPDKQIWGQGINCTFDVTAGGNVRLISAKSSGQSLNISITYVVA